MSFEARSAIPQFTHSGPKAQPIYSGDPIIDLTDLELFRKGQPFEGYARLRKEAPAYFQPENTAGEPGYWAITRYEDVKRVSLDNETFSSEVGGINIAYGPPEESHPLLSPSAINNMIALDAQPHFDLRTQHMPYFTANYLKKLKLKIDAKVGQLLDEMEKKAPECNLVEEFFAHLPLYTLSELLGVPEADRPRLVQWMDDLEMTFYLIAAKNGYIEVTPEIMQAYDGWEDRIAEYSTCLLKLLLKILPVK